MKITPESTRIGWIGTGVMGSSMCGHLIQAGYSATVYNRTQKRAQTLLDAGAQWADSPIEVARSSDVIFTIVGFPNDVREVILGEQGALAGAEKGSVIVDMTTSEPSLAVEIAQLAGQKGVHAIDAPVSGGDVGAREARLSIMIVLAGDGQDHCLSGSSGCGTTYQDGKSGIDRDQYDWRLRSPFVCPTGRIGIEYSS